MKNRFIAAIVTAAALTATPALAADITLPAPAPTFTPSSAYDWSGLYLGGHAGGAFGGEYEGSATTPFIGGGSADSDGFIGGGQIGYNWQFDRIVFGVEGDFSYSDIDASTTLTGTSIGDVPLTAETDWIATVRGRLGYAFDNLLLYGTAGVAFADIEINENFATPSSADNTHVGYALGAGLEYGLTPNWSIRGEYLYTDFGDEDISLENGGATGSLESDNHIARAALNYRFNFAPLPAFGDAK